MSSIAKKIIFNKLPQMIKSIFTFKKGNGISICIRINSSKYFQYLFPQLSCIYNYVDEIIIHYNSISLNEEKSLNDFCSEKEKFVLSKYTTVNFDFVEYSNKMIHSRNFDWCFLFDSDMVFSVDNLIELLKEIRNSKLNNVFFYSGINLFKNNGGGLVSLINNQKINIVHLWDVVILFAFQVFIKMFILIRIN